MKCTIVIPARLASTRLPEKLLRNVGGKSVLQHTYESALRSVRCQEVIVAVDHERLMDEVESFGGKALMTSAACASGTDRIAEVAERAPEIDLFVNVQGDEPEIDPSAIDSVVETLLSHPHASMATAAAPIRDRNRLEDPSCVKIVMAGYRPTLPVDGDSQQERSGEGQGHAIYFSRAPVPMDRSGVNDDRLSAEPPVYWHHLGLYAYRPTFLKWFASQPPSTLEQVECLEQLRAIEAGKQVVVARVSAATPGIDTQTDLDAFARRVHARGAES